LVADSGVKKPMFSNKKGQDLGISSLAGAAITFVVVTVVIVVGLDLLTDTRADFTAASAEFNASTDGIGALANLSSKMDLLATAVILGVIISVLLRVFRVI